MKKLFLFGLLGLRLAAQPVIVNQPTSQTILNGYNAVFTVAVSGTGPFTYQWQFNGTNLPNSLITTVAGNGLNIFAGDGDQATNASIGNATGAAAAPNGDFLIADRFNNRIRQVNTHGIITTIAGTNYGGFGGDGGAATLAKLNRPYGVALDLWGNYFVADTGNNLIRKVDTNGVITTVAGRGTPGFDGDGTAATNAALSAPSGVAVGAAGNLFIADYGNNRIRLVDAAGIISTIAGTNSAGFAGDGGLAVNSKLSSPQGVAVDATGNLFIADYGNNRIRRVDASGIITTFAGTNSSGYFGDGGAATNARLNLPTGVAVDPSGYVIIADCNNNRIRQVSPDGIISTVAGNGSTAYSGDGDAPTNASLNQPFGLTVETAGSLLIADQNHARIRRVTLARVPTLQIFSATTNNAGDYQVVVTSSSGSVTSSLASLAVVFPPTIVGQPQSLVTTNGNPAGFNVTATGSDPLVYQWYFNNTAIDGATNGALSFTNATASLGGNYRCIITNNFGSVASVIAQLVVLTPPTIIAQPTNLTLGNGSSVTLNVGVAGSGPFTYQWRLNGTNLPNRNNRITRVAGGGVGSAFSGDGGLATSAVLWNPSGVAIDSVGNLFIADGGNYRIRMVDTNYVSTTNGLIGIIRTFAGIGAGGYSGDGGMATNAGLAGAGSVTLDAFGNVYLLDSTRIRKVDTNGFINTIAGTNTSGFSGDGGLAANAKLDSPRGAAADPSGNLYFADWNNNRIRKISTNGIIMTVAGTNTSGFSGDGGLAISAQLNHPTGVATDGTGNLFIRDTSRVRRVDINGVITTIAGNGTAGFSGDGGAATNAVLNQLNGIAVDAYGDIFISDSYNNRIRMVDVTGNISTVAGTGGSGYTGDGGLAVNANIYQPAGIGLDAYGNLFIAGSAGGTIRKVDFGRMPTLQLNNVGATNVGNYDVIVSSPYGSFTSSIVSLTVLLPPSITTQPAGIAVPVGSPATFSVAVTNYPPFGYQWFTCSGRGASAIPFFILSGGLVNTLMVDPGAGYTTVPQVKIVGGSGTGATATAFLQSGSILFLNMMNQGRGYSFTNPSTILIDPPSPIVNTPLSGETNATLVLPSVTSDSATNLFVVVTNSYGSVTSTIVQLFVFVPPKDFTAQNQGTNVLLQFTGTPNYLYVLQAATNLTPPIAWQSIATNYPGADGIWHYTVTNVADLPGRFYRTFGK